MSGKFDCFCEGNTEENVLTLLGLAKFLPLGEKRTGKNAINQRLKNILGPKLGSEAVRALVMRDIDEHVGETPAAIKQSVETAFKALFIERKFDAAQVALSPHPSYANLYLFRSAVPDVKLALHLADFRYSERFIKTTFDDYVLALALKAATAEALLQEKNAAEKRRWKAYANSAQLPFQRKWEIAPDGLIEKVRREIPDLLQRNKIPDLQDAKIYLHFYTAVLQEPKSPAVFAKEIVKHARPEDIQQVFAPLLAAAQFLEAAE